MRWALLTIACMLALAFVTKYSGSDATLGLAFTRTGWLYPFFAPLLGWLGVALTGSDTSSNALFGSLQRITAEQLGLNPVLIVASNSTGGVMGKMIDAQSIVVAAVATGQNGRRRKDPAVRVLAQHRAGLPGGLAHAGAGVLAAVDDSRAGEVSGRRVKPPAPRAGGDLGLAGDAVAATLPSAVRAPPACRRSSSSWRQDHRFRAACCVRGS